MVVQTQQLDPQAVSELPRPLRAKNVCLVPTVGALEDAHVLHQAQNLQGDGMVIISSTSHAGFGVRTKASAQITGTLTFLNISAPLRASSRAKSCGVDTMTAPDNTDANVNVALTPCQPVRPSRVEILVGVCICLNPP